LENLDFGCCLQLQRIDQCSGTLLLFFPLIFVLGPCASVIPLLEHCDAAEGRSNLYLTVKHVLILYSRTVVLGYIIILIGF
jgi:hypothetical protein